MSVTDSQGWPHFEPGENPDTTGYAHYPDGSTLESVNQGQGTWDNRFGAFLQPDESGANSDTAAEVTYYSDGGIADYAAAEKAHMKAAVDWQETEARTAQQENREPRSYAQVEDANFAQTEVDYLLVINALSLAEEEHLKGDALVQSAAEAVNEDPPFQVQQGQQVTDYAADGWQDKLAALSPPPIRPGLEQADTADPLASPLNSDINQLAVDLNNQQWPSLLQDIADTLNDALAGLTSGNASSDPGPPETAGPWPQDHSINIGPS